MSGSESLASFNNRTFHLSRPPGFRVAFDAAERNGRFDCIQSQRGKETSIPMQKDSENQSNRQSHPSELSES